MVVGELGLLAVITGLSYRPVLIGWVVVSLAASLLLGRAMSAGTRPARARRTRRRPTAPPDLRAR